jgi:hypothetical protein
MLKVTMVQHVNVQITDRQRTREWYEKVEVPTHPRGLHWRQLPEVEAALAKGSAS